MVILRATNENGLIVDLDVLENDAPIKLDISAIENATIGDVFGASSQTFSLPGTDRNNQFFGNLFNLGATPAVALQNSIDCQVLTDGQEVFTGKLYITDIITNQKGYTTYQVNVVNETIDFKFLLTDTLLSELNWSAYNHNYTYNNITASWVDNLFSGSIVYPHVDYGTPEGDTTLPSYTLGGGARCFDNSEFPLQVNQFKPAIQVKAVLDEIFNSINYKYTSSFVNSAYFGNLYMLMTPNDGLGVYNANPTTGSVWAFRNTSNQTFNALTSTKINFNAEVYDTYNRFDLVNDRYTAYTDGIYNFAVGFNYSISNYSVNNRLRFRVQLLKNGSLTGPSKNFVNVPQTGQIYAPFANIQLKNTDYVELFVELTTDDGTEVITIGFGQNATYFKALGPQASAGGLVDMGLQFPNDMKALDFIQGIIEKFNLVVEPTSGFRNLLTIEPFTDWVASGKVVDWTDKVDRSERFKIVHPITEQPKTIYFRDEDDEAVINKYNFDNFGDTFGTYIYENDSDLPIGEREIGKIFAATPVKGVLNGDTMIIPHLCRKDSTGRELPFKFKPRLLFNNGLQNMPVTALGKTGSIINPGNYFIIDELFVKHTEDQFLQMTTFEYLPTDASGSISGSRDLHFGNLNWWQYFQNVQSGKTTQDAYHVYWAAYINSLYDIDARKLTCNVYLKPTELQDIQLNDKIFIDGAYYRINRINGANLSYRDSVEVELIKELNRLLPYPRRRVLDSVGTAVDIVVKEIQADGNVIYEDFDGGATVDNYGIVQQAAFKDGFTIFNNNNTGSVTWNIPASVTADQSRVAFGENQLDDSVGLVLVAGSNNTVQTQTENSLVNGSNNTLNAGSKNATIIGTNNTIDILTENISILGATDSSVTGPNNNSVILGGTGSLLNNTDWAIMINGYNADIIDSDNTTAINSHDQEVIVNGSGHTVIGLNLEGAGLDLLDYRANSNWLGDTYLGEALFRERRQLECGDGFSIDLSDTQYRHDNLYILNWSGLSPGTTTIDLPNAVNNDYKKVVLQFQSNGTFDGTTDVNFTPFGAQTINGVATYTLSNAYDGVTFTTSGSGWLALAGGAGGSTEASYLSAYNSSSISPSANVSASVPLPNVEFSQNISIVSGSRITFDRAGVYDIQFSAQAVKSSGANVTVLIWIKKNGVDVDWTNTEAIIAGNANDEIVLAWNWYVEAQSNDYYEIAYVADTSTLTWQAKTGVTGPDIPSWIVSAGSIGGGSTFISGSGGDPNALYTASVSLNTITFTKGNGTTFPITVGTGSGGATFPYTGSAQITGSLGVTGSISNRGNVFIGNNGFPPSASFYAPTYTSLYTEGLGANNAFIATLSSKMSGSNNTTEFQEIFNSNLIAATTTSSMTIDDVGTAAIIQYSAIVGGISNEIKIGGGGSRPSSTIFNSAILGGEDNTIEIPAGGPASASPKDNIIIGGEDNTIQQNGSGRRNAIISSYSSSITDATDSVIIGAQSSSITHDDVIILGGSGVSSIKADTIYTTNMVVSANKVFTLTPTTPLPTTGVLTGSFAVSSSSPPKPYFWDGSAWNALF